ncbi:expressed unknown protein [Seminavis robusta]|uniref:Uncharacterized protein n=1 Tax=Seminavis robusta TaxID=568900 RepID=A0A9N8HCM6_9STRA|nr:expressed unknown protein [Seminavis robusta]|eukprot:Sro324_g117610.1 n/a (395) ;mRNA; f:52418-53602
MVVQGGFSLHLIDAESQQPLKEYRGPSGAVHYAEAKPGGEYFLRFQVLREEDNKAEDDKAKDKAKDDKTKESSVDTQSEIMYYFRPCVDGKDLGFYTNLTNSQGARDVGLWTYINGIGANQALKFETAAPNNNKEATSGAGLASGNAAKGKESSSETTPGKTGPPLLHMGNVQVQVSKAIFTGRQKRVYSAIPALTQEETVVTEAAVPVSAASSLHEEEEETGTANGADAKEKDATGSPNDPSKLEETLRIMEPVPVLRSREGKARFEQKITEECPTYKPGELLETITIHYGSAAALVQAGVLLPAGTVPQYVGVSPQGTATSKEAASVTPIGKGVVANPLLDASTSTEPTGAKRLHAGDVKNEDGVKPPATKKPCREVSASTPEPMSAAVVSK